MASDAAEESFLSDDLLGRITRGEPGVSAGVGAAAVAATGAALVVRVCHASHDEWAEARAAAAQGQALIRRLDRLAARDAHAYAVAVRDLRAEAPSGGDRDHGLATSLKQAAEIPALMAEACADVAELAAEASEHARGDSRADAAAAAMFAQGAAQAAGHLVAINLATRLDDASARQAGDAVSRAAAATRRAQAASI